MKSSKQSVDVGGSKSNACQPISLMFMNPYQENGFLLPPSTKELQISASVFAIKGL